MGKKITLNPEQKQALSRFAESMNGRIQAHLNACVHCGLCAETCHYYLSTGDEKYMPANKVDQLARIYKRYQTVAGKIIPRWVGAADFDKEAIDEMIDVLFGGCTMCGRCALHCSIGVDIPFLVRTARTLLADLDLVPATLESTVQAAIETGNNMGIPREELIDTLEWLEEDLRMEVEDDHASIPLDVKGKDILYTLNPREPKFFPMSISAIAKIFYAADASWSISSNCYDVTNYAYYSGENKKAGELVQRLVDEVVSLQAETLVLAECGHGSRAIRWEGPNWIGKPYPFKVFTVVELLAYYIRDGRLTLDKTKNTIPVTLHDPCNLVRSGGVLEEQRFILDKAVLHFTEMSPNRENNYCCGGGGGQLAMSEYAERRLVAGQLKADQIRNTGAKIVATPCHNCADQLMELNNHYKLGVQIKTIAELVADALVIKK